jgi:tight adherence protein B
MTGFIIGFSVFAAGLCVLLFIWLSMRDERKEMRQRVNVAMSGERPAKGLTTTVLRGPITQINDWLKAGFGLGIARQWGTKTPGLVLLMWGLASAGVTFFLAHLIGLKFWALPPAALAFFLVPNVLLRLEEERTEEQFIKLFPDAVDIIIRMLRAGLPVDAAIRVVGNEGAPPVDKVFLDLANQLDVGAPLSEALAAMGARIGLPDVRFFAVAASLQQGTGGNLASTLDILSDIVRKRSSMRQKAKAVTAEVRMSAYMLASLPFFVLVGLLFLQPSYLSVLIVDRRGNLILLAAGASMAFGLLTMRHMMRRASRF